MGVIKNKKTRKKQKKQIKKVMRNSVVAVLFAILALGVVVQADD